MFAYLPAHPGPVYPGPAKKSVYAQVMRRGDEMIINNKLCGFVTFNLANIQIKWQRTLVVSIHSKMNS